MGPFGHLGAQNGPKSVILALFGHIWPVLAILANTGRSVVGYRAPGGHIGPRWPKMAQNGPKWPKMGHFGPKRALLAPRGPIPRFLVGVMRALLAIWAKVAKRPKMAQNGPFWPFWASWGPSCRRAPIYAGLKAGYGPQEAIFDHLGAQNGPKWPFLGSPGGQKGPNMAQNPLKTPYNQPRRAPRGPQDPKMAQNGPFGVLTKRGQNRRILGSKIWPFSLNLRIRPNMALFGSFWATLGFSVEFDVFFKSC